MSEPKTAEVKVVPVEPTEAMLDAVKPLNGRRVWSAMLAASPPAETGEGFDLERIAKDAAERVHKNGGCVPQLAFAPILFALQDALSAHPASDQSDTERMRAALEPFAKIGGQLMLTPGGRTLTLSGMAVEHDGIPSRGSWSSLKAAHFYEAFAALAEKAADQ